MNSNTRTNPAPMGWSPVAQFASASKLLNIGTSVIGRLAELNVTNLRHQGASNLSHLKSLTQVRDFSALVETQRQFLQSSWKAQEASMKAACKVLQQGMEAAQTALRPNSEQPSPTLPTTAAPEAAAVAESISQPADVGTSRVFFEIYQDKAGEYRFRLQGADGRTLLRSEGYRKRRGAVNGVSAVKKNARNDDRYERQTSSAGKPSFNLRAGNHQVIGSSRTFPSAMQMDTAIELIKQAAPVSKVRDLTAAA